MEQGRTKRILRLALDLGVSPLAYYGLLITDVATPRALLVATVVAGGWLLGTTLRDRQVDGLATFMLGMYAVMLVLALATSDQRLLLARDPLTSILAGAVFLGSCSTSTPATAYLAHRLHGRPLHDARRHRMHVVESLVLGLGLVTEGAARLALVFVLPVDVVAGLAPAIEFAVLPVLVAWMVWHRRRSDFPPPGPTGETAGSSHPSPATRFGEHTPVNGCVP